MSFLAAMIKWLTDRVEPVEFVRINYVDSGNFCVVELRDASVLIEEEPFGSITIEHLTMTRRQFENLPEFSGP